MSVQVRRKPGKSARSDARREQRLIPRRGPPLLDASDVLELVHVANLAHALLLGVLALSSFALEPARRAECVVRVKLVAHGRAPVAPRATRKPKEGPVARLKAWDLLEQRGGRGGRGGSRGRGRVRDVRVRAAEERLEMVLEVVELEQFWRSVFALLQLDCGG